MRKEAEKYENCETEKDYNMYIWLVTDINDEWQAFYAALENCNLKDDNRKEMLDYSTDEAIDISI
jgi:hypothetical protein